MKLFGKKSKSNVKPKKKKQFVFSAPLDQKMFRILPIGFIFAVVLICIGVTGMMTNNKAFKNKQLASSMKVGEELPQFGKRKVDGKINIQAMKKSKDGKDLAVDVKYDDTASANFSMFGDRYKLRLVVAKKDAQKFKNIKINYGFLNVDQGGNGIIHVHNDNGFEDAAFIIMLVDTSRLLTNTETNDIISVSSNDESLDKSIQGQLADNLSSDSSSSDAEKSITSPIVYIRLNGKSMVSDTQNWKNDRDLVNGLIVKDSIKTQKSKIYNLNKQKNTIDKNINEFKQRLDEEPDDDISKQQLEQNEAKLDNINNNISKANDNLKNQEKAKYSNESIGKKVNSYETYKVDSLSDAVENRR